MFKKATIIVFGLMLIIQVKNLNAQTYLGTNLTGSTTYSPVVGNDVKIDVNGTSFKGTCYSRMSSAASYHSGGAGLGVVGSVSNFSTLKGSSTGPTYGIGGSFGVSLKDFQSTATNGAKLEVVGLKGQLSGTISSTAGPIIITAIYGNDLINTSKTWAGYFNGKVGINGTLKAEEIIVENVAADYVFTEGYNLRSLEEVEEFINENGHLPDVAPASETVKGVNVSEFNTLLLQKIEELTLYVIELKKENEALSSKINK